MRRIIAAVVLLALGLMLALMVSEMPPFGQPDNPSNNVVSRRYTGECLDDVNVPNIVSAIIIDYRGYDTLGETTVLFAGIAAVLSVLAAHVAAGREDAGDG
ncbi:MAG: hydrogen gas-evolving membrane-bound hydrogenase subunit E [Bacillota bacterium]